MTKSNLCDYTDVYIDVKGTITVPNTGRAATQNNINKEVVFQNYAPFTNCIGETSNIQRDNAKGIDLVIHMYNLTENRKEYSKTCGSLQ